MTKIPDCAKWQRCWKLTVEKSFSFFPEPEHKKVPFRSELVGNVSQYLWHTASPPDTLQYHQDLFNTSSLQVFFYRRWKGQEIKRQPLYHWTWQRTVLLGNEIFTLRFFRLKYSLSESGPSLAESQRHHCVCVCARACEQQKVKYNCKAMYIHLPLSFMIARFFLLHFMTRSWRSSHVRCAFTVYSWDVHRHGVFMGCVRPVNFQYRVQWP